MDYDSQLYKTCSDLMVAEDYHSLLHLCKDLDSSNDEEMASFWRGLVSQQLQNYQDAISQFVRCLHLNPNNDRAWSNLGVIYEQIEKLDLSLSAHKKAFMINPRSKVNILNLGNCYGLNFSRHMDAENIFEKGLSIFPRDREIAQGLVTSLVNQGFFNEAKKVSL